jgi:hypothetical protein
MYSYNPGYNSPHNQQQQVYDKKYFYNNQGQHHQGPIEMQPALGLSSEALNYSWDFFGG